MSEQAFGNQMEETIHFWTMLILWVRLVAGNLLGFILLLQFQCKSHLFWPHICWEKI